MHGGALQRMHGPMPSVASSARAVAASNVSVQLGTGRDSVAHGDVVLLMVHALQSGLDNLVNRLTHLRFLIDPAQWLNITLDCGVPISSNAQPTLQEALVTTLAAMRVVLMESKNHTQARVHLRNWRINYASVAVLQKLPVTEHAWGAPRAYLDMRGSEAVLTDDEEETLHRCLAKAYTVEWGDGDVVRLHGPVCEEE